MSVPKRPEPLYLKGRAGPIFTMLHKPFEKVRDTAVLLCPPFGWEEICSYRSRWEWATHLADAGYPTMRLDMPGTGDSGGSPRDPNLFEAWQRAVCESAEQLRSHTDCTSVAAVGIGLGGLVLWKAICDGAGIDQIVMWSVPARGRSLIRELRAFARLEEGTATPDSDHQLADGDLLVGGFLLGGKTVAAIEAIDVTSLHPPPNLPRRVLMLDRDGMAVEQRLLSHLVATGAEIRCEPGHGFGAMTAKPHHARAPREVFVTVTSWLDSDTSRVARRQQETASACSQSVRHDATPPAGAQGAEKAAGEMVLDEEVIESTVTVPQPFGELFGVLARPARAPQADMCLLLLNAGAIRRVGPNRMWVEAARRWAARGVPTLRLDLEGIGDASGDGERFDDLAELYIDSLVEQVRAAIDVLQARDLGPDFVLCGLCSGAYWSFHGALEDERVVAALLLNPRALYWDPSIETARELRRGMLRTGSWRKALGGQVPAARLAEVAGKVPSAPLVLARRALSRSRARRTGTDALALAFDRLRDMHKPVLFLFSGDEPLLEELEHDGYLDRMGAWPNVELQSLPGEDHTLRPIAAQQDAHRALDSAIERLRQSRVAAV